MCPSWMPMERCSQGLHTITNCAYLSLQVRLILGSEGDHARDMTKLNLEPQLKDRKKYQQRFSRTETEAAMAAMVDFSPATWQ